MEVEFIQSEVDLKNWIEKAPDYLLRIALYAIALEDKNVNEAINIAESFRKS